MNKGKNTVHLFTGVALLDQVHESVQNCTDIDNQNLAKARVNAARTGAKGNIDKGPLQDTVGDNVISATMAIDKYSLEMNTASKVSTYGWSREAKENKIHMAQTNHSLALLPFMGYKAVCRMQIETLYVQIDFNCISY